VRTLPLTLELKTLLRATKGTWRIQCNVSDKLLQFVAARMSLSIVWWSEIG
jgi:hypothetical protein